MITLRKRGDDDIERARPRGNIIAAAMLLIPLAIGMALTVQSESPWGVLAGFIVGFVLMQSPKVAKQWERGVVLRLGRLCGPARARTVLGHALHRLGQQVD